MTSTVDPKTTGLPRGIPWIFGSTAAAVTGQGAVTAAAPLLAAALTRDPLQVAVVAAAAWLPWLLIGLPAGALVDRWDPRMVMVSTDAARALLVAGFALLVLTGRASVWILATAVFLAGIGACFFDPASQSEIPALAGKDPEVLASINGTFWSIDTLARALVGATLGAALFSWHPAAPFFAYALLLSASALMLLGLPKRHVAPTEPHARILAAVQQGLTVLWQSEILRRNAVLMGAYNFAYNLVFATLILLLQRNLSINAFIFGVLLACAAVGGVLGGWIARALTWGPTAAYAVGFAGQAAGWLLVGTAPTVPVAALGFVIIGGVSTLVSAIGGAAMQRATPDGLLGRVTSATRLVGIGSAAAGSLLAGLVAAIGGLAAPSVVAIALLVVCALWAAGVLWRTRTRTR